MLTHRDNSAHFQLEEGHDHIEIVVKTVDLGESDTPGSTMSL